MPLPVWLIPLALKGAAVTAGAVGVGSAVHGAKKVKDANDTMKAANSRHEKNIAKFEKENEITSKAMDKLGKLELEILHSFSEFSDVFEQIKNRPIFENYSKNGVTLPKYDSEKIKEVSNFETDFTNNENGVIETIKKYVLKNEYATID